MDLEEEAPSFETPKTTNITRTGQNPDNPETKARNRESQGSTLPKYSLYSSKERFRGRQVNSRPLKPERIHRMSPLQDANNERGKTAITQGLLDSVPRPERWVLASRSVEEQTPLFRVPLRRSGLAVQSYAIRSKHSSQNLHKSRSSRSAGYGKRRSLLFTLPRRSSHRRSFKRRVLSSRRTSSVHSGSSGLDNQHKEIQTTTSSKVRVARRRIRPHVSHSKGPSRESGFAATETEKGNNVRIQYSKRSYAVTRRSKLGRPVRSSSQGTNITHTSHNQDPQEISSRLPSLLEQRSKTRPLQMGVHSVYSTVSRRTISRRHSSDRCIIKGLGYTHRRDPLCGQVRPLHERIRDSHPRTVGHLVRSDHNSRERSSYSSTLRQHNCSFSSQERDTHRPSPVISDGINLEKSCEDAMDVINIIHQGELQCPSRSTVEGSHSSDRVVSPPEKLREDSQTEPQASGRPVCHQAQQSTEDICVAMPRQESRCSGRPVYTMEQMGSPVPLSSNEFDFEGFLETEQIDLQNSHFSHSRDADQTLVHDTTVAESSLYHSHDEPSTGSTWRTGDHGPVYEASRVAVIEAGLRKEFPELDDEEIRLQATDLKPSTLNDYQHKWKVFTDFLTQSNIYPEEVRLGSVVKFFHFLFTHKGLKPGTVRHYRSAISYPLIMLFNIDLTAPEPSKRLAKMFKSFEHKRPNAISTSPQWSLNKVLTFLDNLPQPLSDELLLRKTAFLLLLATGWRISELHACVREEKYCHFSRNMLRLRPHEIFLAKNELPCQRWEHKEIVSLKLPDGSTSKLCPVNTLQEYLDRSRGRHTGPLFCTLGRTMKPLSKHQLSTQICQLILKADPLTAVKVHDVRSYASSYALTKTMLIGDLMREIHWSSPSTFFKYYMTSTEPLLTPVVLPLMGGPSH